MNPYSPPYAPPEHPYRSAMPTAEDESHLNTLALCHFIYAGLVGLIGLFGLIYVALGIAVATAGSHEVDGGREASMAVGSIFAIIGGVITVLL